MQFFFFLKSGSLDNCFSFHFFTLFWCNEIFTLVFFFLILWSVFICTASSLHTFESAQGLEGWGRSSVLKTSQTAFLAATTCLFPLWTNTWEANQKVAATLWEFFFYNGDFRFHSAMLCLVPTHHHQHNTKLSMLYDMTQWAYCFVYFILQTPWRPAWWSGRVTHSSASDCRLTSAVFVFPAFTRHDIRLHPN